LEETRLRLQEISLVFPIFKHYFLTAPLFILTAALSILTAALSK